MMTTRWQQWIRAALVVAASLPLAVDALAIDKKVAASTDHWSLKPIVRVEPPAVKDTAWSRNPIDQFILASLEAKGLTHAPRADRATLVRRMMLVMHGLPPTPQDIAAFERDERPDAYEQLVKRVLDSPHYGERFGRHWLDVARYADTNGFETNTPRPNAWRYRDWVIAAFNNDLPYDQFVTAQLAGDAVGDDAATGFLVAGPYDVVKSPDINLTLMQREDELSDIVNAASTGFLGLTVACAKCHDHKFDPIAQSDYYKMKAVFAGVTHGDRAIRTPADKNKEQEIEELKARIAQHRAKLNELAPPPPAGPPPFTVFLDDRTPLADGRGVEVLSPQKGFGVNPAGTGRGYKDDTGDFDRLPNVSQGSYTWWEGAANTDLMAYRPAIAGRFRVWVSWGCGWDTHATDTEYLLDADGDMKTTADQHLIARVDQQAFSDGVKKIDRVPLWSGFFDAGAHVLAPTTALLVRSGATTRPASADAVVFQSEPARDEGAQAPTDIDTAPRTNKEAAPGTGHVWVPRLRSPPVSTINEERFAPVTARFVRLTIEATNTGSEPCVDELEIYSSGADARNVALATAGGKPTSSGNYQGNPKHQLDHINDGKYSNDWSWISNEAGKGWLQIELAQPTPIDRIVWGRDRERQFTDRLATRYRIEAAVEPGQWRTIASSNDRLPYGTAVEDIAAYRFVGLSRDQAVTARGMLDEIKRFEQRITDLSAKAVGYAGNFSQPQETHVLYRGDPMAPRDPVAPDAIASLLKEYKGNDTLGMKLDEPEQKRRIELAQWITSKDNPLTARVIVNRIWAWHFGEGIVNTPSDFGRMGAEPTHPQLLDWLADELIRSGWSIKHIQKLILTSATWQQASTPRPEALKVDAKTELLWRYPPRRLEAEAIRDSVLFVTGALDMTMGGPGFDTFQPNSNYVRNYVPKDTFDAGDWRRMVYMYRVRMETDATFGIFDCPDAGQTCPERSNSTTALQALNLLNSSFMLQQADVFAARLESLAGGDANKQVLQAFSHAFGRAPTESEQVGAVALIKQHGLPAFCRAMLNANEFLFVQ